MYLFAVQCTCIFELGETGPHSRSREGTCSRYTDRIGETGSTTALEMVIASHLNHILHTN
jgi:hypothetical protein